MRTMAEAATELRALKTQKETQEAELKSTKDKIDKIELVELPEILEAAGAENARVPGVGTIYVTNDPFASVLKDDEEQFFAYLREQGQGDIVKETVHPGTLKAWAKEQLANAKKLPGFVKVAYITRAHLRKS